MTFAINIAHTGRGAFLAGAAALACVLTFGISPVTMAADKIRIQKLDDLPRQTYAIQGKASDLLRSRQDIDSLADRVRKDTEELLAKYQIEDASTLQGLYGKLASVAFLQGDEAAVMKYVEQIRSLETKESSRLTQGVLVRAWFAARRETEAPPESPEFRASFHRHYAEAVSGLPWDTVQTQLKQLKGTAEMVNEALIYGQIAGTFDAAVEKSGYLSGDQAAALLNARQVIELLLPVKQEVASVLADVVAANQREKVDIWPARALVLEPGHAADSVRVGIWDTGVDVAVFAGRMWKNARETANGRDDDGNGLVDDLNGIAFDRNHEPSAALLYPLENAEGRRDELEGLFKGLFDLQASLETPQSAALKERMAKLDPAAVPAFMEDLGLYTYHAHGTHVAGIAIAGNAYAEIVAARLGGDHHLIPDPPTMDLARAGVREFQATVDYFKKAGARVVNMSWVMSAKGFEDDLEKNGIGKDQEERATMAREMFVLSRDGLRAAFESAPEILFVGGAGNSDNDVNFDEFVPPAFDLPNLIIAGAVDQTGEATNFTSFGGGVDVYSNGFEVESFVPGGHLMKLSGTSMASPNVANLAAKLIALDPSLTPARVIDLIERGAEPGGPGGKLLVINPRRSAELLRDARARKS